MREGFLWILSACQGADLMAAVQLKIRGIRIELAAQKIGERYAQVRGSGVRCDAAYAYRCRRRDKWFMMYKNMPQTPFLWFSQPTKRFLSVLGANGSVS